MFGFPFVDHKTSAHKRPRPCANSMLFTVRYARYIPYIPSGRSEATRQKSDAIVREESKFLPPSPARRIFYERRNSEQVVVITGIFLRCLLSPPPCACLCSHRATGLAFPQLADSINWIPQAHRQHLLYMQVQWFPGIYLEVVMTA